MNEDNFNCVVLNYFDKLENNFNSLKSRFNRNYEDMAKFQDHLNTFYQYHFIGKGHIYIFSIDLNFNVDNPLFKLQFFKDGNNLIKSLKLNYSELKSNEHSKINDFYIKNITLCNKFLESEEI